jgi:hypothetical protein
MPLRYEIIFMLRDGTTVSRWRDGSPPPQSLFFYKPVHSVFFTRWYPVFKVWRVYDLRQFKVLVGGKDHNRVIVPRHSTALSDRDAAIMWMGLMLNA